MVTATLLQAVMSMPEQHIIDIGTRLALIGMGTVFIGLVILSLSLPLIKRLAEGKKKKKTTADSDFVSRTEGLANDEVVAIATAIHAHFLKINQMEEMKLTWEMYERPYSPWRLAGRSKILLDRTAFRQRNRSR
ncbi:MAG: OadG family protein [Candidatus Sabulitectum sp.]|nr:OadG family protein [Candidatus Sabulitectum sp.]